MRIERGIHRNFGNYACPVRSCKLWQLQGRVEKHFSSFYTVFRRYKARSQKWVEWVKLKRAKWEPSKHSHLCSVHFKETDFIRQFGSEVALTNRSLLRDEIGVCVYPCYHTAADREKPLSERDKRMVRKTFYVRVTYKACCS